jgi:hypothetical protein
MRRFLVVLSFFFGLVGQAAAQDCAALCNACYNAVRADSVYNQQLGAITQYCNACNNCRQGGQQQSTGCPGGYEPCGNMCCGGGNYCSRYGCIARGSVDCGNSYCQPGQKCARSGRGCYPEHVVDCGEYSCEPGKKCGNGWRACLAEDAVDCGPRAKSACDAGRVCWTASADVPGSLKKGQLYCLTDEQVGRAADLIAQQKRREHDQKEAKRRAEQEKREAEKQRALDRQAELARKKQEALEAARRAEQARKLAAEEQRRRQQEDRALQTLDKLAKKQPAQKDATALSTKVVTPLEAMELMGKSGGAATVRNLSNAEMIHEIANGRSPQEVKSLRVVEISNNQTSTRGVSSSVIAIPESKVLAPSSASVVSLAPPTGPSANAIQQQPRTIPPAMSSTVTGFSAPPGVAQYKGTVTREVAVDSVQYATMARDAYSNPNNNAFKPVGYQRDVSWWRPFEQAGLSKQQIKEIEKSGFSASLYRNEAKKEIAIAYRGTDFDSVVDWRNNAAARFKKDVDTRLVVKQYSAAADLAKYIAAQNPGYTVTLTGHSLGGALAAYAGNQTNNKVVTFNAARNLYSTDNNPNQTNIVISRDIVGDQVGALAVVAGHGSLAGNTYTLTGTSGDGVLLRHGLDGIIGGLSDAARHR